MGISLEEVFHVKKPIIGMIHLAGRTRDEKILRAFEELIIYEKEGVDGAIIENYLGDEIDVVEVLKNSKAHFKKIVRGVNVLGSPYQGFQLASDFGAKFVQFDSVQTKDIELGLYNSQRLAYPNICVLGGVGFKYVSPTGNPLEQDLDEAKSRCEAIVTTGVGTGKETPIEKLKQYKELLKEFPLIVGAGVNSENAYEQLSLCDGAIIGSYFKPRGDTTLKVERLLVRNIMDIARQVRENN